MDNSSGIYYGGVAPQAKKPFITKKRVIVAGAVLVVIAVCGAILISFLSKPTWGKTREAFNIYGNYLLSGEKLTADLTGEYIRTNVYKMEGVLTESRENIVTYYQEANRLFNGFIKLSDVTISRTEGVDELGRYIESQKLLFGFAYKYATVEGLSEQMILDKYLSEGEDSARTYIKERYDSFTNDSNELIKEFGELKTEQFEIQVKILSVYQEEGCIKGGKMDSECANETYYSDGLKDASRLAELRYQTSLLVGTHRYDLLKGCWNISGALANVRDE